MPAGMLLNMDVDDWREIRRQALDVRNSELHQAIHTLLKQRMATQTAILTNPKSTEVDIRLAQGSYNAHKRDIMIIEDLVRMADSTGRKEKANDR